MKKITYEEFLRLVRKSNRITIDGKSGEASIDDGFVEFFFNREMVRIHDDAEFNWSPIDGKVNYLDSDNIPVEVRFFIEFPLQEIPAK